MTKEKKHADFQDKYRRSSNFGKSENLKPEEDGKLTAEEKDKKSTKEIRNSVDNLLDEEE
ncbi:hypothetical protein [Luteirhabdus pelagi]|uniref:hypothetical protein n=1 Tax=Luteirhabdus pelagi TaxID=2792783 RepID=UPI0019395A56|nr:hypothetical protein [Luteirhabdus pelagi]